MDFHIYLLLIGLGILVILAYIAGKALGKRYMFEVMQDVLEEEKKKAVEKSRSVLKGQFSEQLSPFAPDFPGKPSEARFFGAPIDFIIFKGLDEQHVEEVIFLDIKTGKASLNKTQRSIKKAIDEKRVSFKEYRI